ncbi:hypothetical protein ABB37_01207 [Leptomonas pyrrhocoris]|uniref:Clu domain-containing protein n=1 Tax=Leptomonas pyrrhocoris TaxID=157538 RepID=A0A0M9G8B4_LEPPY|nr:hypothetical protein ABB37_01207 [Leptomonas pyrrhocoris]KPA84703.1 hypothetical protein ABB37_01207 [Leptomonas pyrrhocoris]|eukprot:XP_015663142.1 hypothetical protein ABB37_01207 [Leptomonas pyrrhocoris]
MAFPQVNAAAIAELEAKHFLFQDTILFQYYWDSVPAKSEHRDWNEEYQRALEEYRMMPQLSSSSNDAEGTPTTAKDTLTQVLEEFRQEVVESVMRVCAEAVLPLAQRRLCAMPQHANEVFFINGLVIKRCVDTADGDLGGDGLAAKLGNAMYRNNEIIALEAPSHFLYTPLQARCTFGGHSFLCSTIPPYGRRNLLYASPCLSAATGKTSGPCSESTASSGNDVPFAAPSSPPPLVLDLLRRLGNALHLHGGEVPWEWRVYAGRDRRLYLSHTARLLPPVLPLVQERRRGVHGSAPSSASETGPTSAAQTESEEDVRLFPHIVRSRVRPEVFLNWPTEWRANECCFVADEAQQHQPRPTTETELRQAAVESTSSAVGQWIKADGITRVAGIIGFHLPLSAVPMPIAVCNGCQSTIDANEIRLVVCTNPSRCCRVCIQCYTRGVMGNGDAEAGEEPSSDERLSRIWADAVRCGAGCRRAGCVLMEPSITAITHAHGLNLRYLPYVLHRLPLSARPAVEHFIHVELVARAAKYVLQQDLCRATTATEARSVCEAVLSALLQPTGAVSEHFWRTRLGPVLQAHFEGICEPFQVSVHALCAVAERAQSLTGVWLSDASLASLDALSASAKPTPLLRRDIRENANTSESGAAAAANNDDARPFVEIVSITPRTWVFPVAPLHPTAAAAPDLSDKESSQASPLWRRLESIILFWIGYTPEDAEDRLQPFYLDDSMFHSNA